MASQLHVSESVSETENKNPCVISNTLSAIGPSQYHNTLAGSSENEASSSQLVEANNPTTVFTFFPKLPIEIRHKIWREIFPESRYIDLKYVHHAKQARSRRHKHPLPLHVNRESRAETLRYYGIMFDASIKARIDPRGSYISLTRDHFTIMGISAVSNGLLDDRLSWLEEDFPGGLKYIRELTVFCCHLGCPSLEGLQVATEKGRGFNALLRLSGLERLTILLHPCHYSITERAKGFKQMIEDFFELKEDKFVGGKAPTVEFKLWGSHKFR